MARKERTLKNGTAAIIKYVVKLILQFILRTLIIYKLGVEYVGLDSLYANIISMLSLAELGIGSAIVFCMYKPAAENDVEKLKSLNSLYKKLYFIIASIVLIIGLAISPFLKYLISGKPNVKVNIHYVYFIFLANTIISYLGAHKKSLLFAYQRYDIENNIMTTCIFAMSILQIVLLLIFKNYYYYAILIPIFTLIEVIVIVIVANKKYPEINGKAQPLDKETKKLVLRNIIGASCHQIGAVIVMSTDNLLISMFFGLTVLGKISNYILIYNAIHSFVMILIQALQASVGNLIATVDEQQVYKKYGMFNLTFSCIAGLFAILLMCLYQPFISIWVGEKYLVSIWLVLAIVARFYFTEMRALTNMFKNCAGLMWNDRIKPIIESFVNIAISIALIYLMGVEGIFVGTIISTICVPLWVEPYILHKHYFKKSVRPYFIKLILFTFVTLIAGASSFFICSLLPELGIKWFILKILISFVISLGIYLIAYYKTKDFKGLINTFLKPLLKKKK